VVKDRLHGVLAVSRSFGDAEHKRKHGAEMWGKQFSADPCTSEPEITFLQLSPLMEFAVVACDGLWDVLTSQQVVNFVRRRLLAHSDAARAARELVSKALEVGSLDNVSAIVVMLATSADSGDLLAELPQLPGAKSIFFTR
jgi:protein phosphatase 2C family protein 2/3